jgi:hypothetical protein
VGNSNFKHRPTPNYIKFLDLILGLERANQGSGIILAHFPIGGKTSQCLDGLKPAVCSDNICLCRLLGKHPLNMFDFKSRQREIMVLRDEPCDE